MRNFIIVYKYIGTYVLSKLKKNVLSKLNGIYISRNPPGTLTKF